MIKKPGSLLENKRKDKWLLTLKQNNKLKFSIQNQHRSWNLCFNILIIFIADLYNAE